jgi:carbon monoxide dehydrogenase subunit G
MCIGPRVGKQVSLYDLDIKTKANLAKKLPQLNEHRIKMVTKHILHNFLDKLAENIFTNGKIYTMDEKNP